MNAERTTGACARQHVLLICPSFFGYHQSIVAALESLGYDVTWWDDRASNHPGYKAALRLLPQVTARLSARAFRRRLDRMKGVHVDRILVVKGEGLSVGTVKAIQARWPDAHRALYFWDSVENMPRALELAQLFEHVATFDPVDAARHGWMDRPLFARSVSTTHPPSTNYDWCFIGTMHSDRHRIVQRLAMGTPAQRRFIYFFVQSRPMKLLRMLSDPSLWRGRAGTVSTAPLPRDQVSSVVSLSRAVLDVEHPAQRGLTMRSIETLLSARKLITTNPHMRSTDLYAPSRVCVISRDAPHIPPGFLDSDPAPLPSDVRQRYTIEQWVEDLIGLPPSRPVGESASPSKATA